jgi:spore maturation protein CgeB
MNELYSNFALSLNITEVWDTYVLKRPVHKLHLRAFEIPMCGGLQFAPNIEELAGYFEDDKEIVLYNDKNEYIDKAKYYLQEKLYNKRIEMKKAARLRVEQEHTWMNRFDKIFSMLNI